MRIHDKAEPSKHANSMNFLIISPKLEGNCLLLLPVSFLPFSGKFWQISSRFLGLTLVVPYERVNKKISRTQNDSEEILEVIFDFTSHLLHEKFNTNSVLPD